MIVNHRRCLPAEKEIAHRRIGGEVGRPSPAPRPAPHHHVGAPRPPPPLHPALRGPLNPTLPPPGPRRPAPSFRSVDLPAPLGPIRATISPAATARSAPFTISSAAA